MSTTTGPMPVLPQRVRPPMFTRRHVPPLNPEQLEYVAGRIQHLDDRTRPYPGSAGPEVAGHLAALAPGETALVPRLSEPAVVDKPAGAAAAPAQEPTPTPIGDAAEAYVKGTGPRPACAAPEPAPALSSVPGWPEGTVRGLLIGALWDAARWYGDMGGAGCEDCCYELLCAWHRERAAKATGFVKLYDCTCAALTDAAAVSVVAGVIRSGGISPGDLAAPLSPLEGILAGALSANGGAR